jgi:hypothetical protein
MGGILAGRGCGSLVPVDPELIGALKTLTDATRLRIVGRLAAGPGSLEEVARDLGLPLAVVVRQVGLLRRFGVVGPPGRAAAARHELRLDTLQELGRALDELEPAEPGPALDASLPAEDAKVLRGYVGDGRLTAIPAHSAKRLVVLRWLRDQVFTEDRDYPEKEVNQRLALFHPDVASLRRYMVDARLVSRERGLYRRVARDRPADDASDPARPFSRPGV